MAEPAVPIHEDDDDQDLRRDRQQQQPSSPCRRHPPLHRWRTWSYCWPACPPIHVSPASTLCPRSCSRTAGCSASPRRSLPRETPLWCASCLRQRWRGRKRDVRSHIWTEREREFKNRTHQWRRRWMTWRPLPPFSRDRKRTSSRFRCLRSRL